MTSEQHRKLFETVKNWDRWGADDEAGALNLIPPDLRAVAALSPAVVRVSLYPSGGLETMTPRSGGAACGLLGAPG